jgi:hypothetical protein
MPADDRTKNLFLRFVIDNILEKQPNFAYQIVFGAGSSCAFDAH